MAQPQIASVRLGARVFSLVCAFALCALTTYGQTPVESRSLSPNQILERELRGGESHLYQIQLEAGQVAQVEAVQSGIDITVSLYGTDGKLSVTLDGKGGRLWRETVSCLAETKGACRVEISSSGKDFPAGNYTIKLGSPRAATSQDRERLLAERALGEGRELYENNKRAEALAKFEEAAIIWQKLGDKYWEAVTLYNIGLTRNNLSKTDEAITALEQALNLLREQKDKLGEGKTAHMLGNSFLNGRKIDKAQSYFEQALTVRREIKDRRGESDSLLRLGIINYLLGEPGKAKDFYEQALLIKRQIKDRAGESDALGNLGVVADDLGEYNKALSYYEQVLAIKRELKDRAGESDSINNLGIVYKNLGNVDKARDYYEQALAIKREIKDRRGEANALGNLGNLYDELAQYDRARDYFEQVLTIMRETKDMRGERTVLTNLGSVYTNLGQYQKAREGFELVLLSDRELKDRRGEGRTLGNLGVVYAELGQHEKAREYYEQALVIKRETKDKRGEGNTLSNLGNAHKELGQYEKALAYHEQALAVHREIKDRQGESTTLNNLANVYRNLKQYEKARDYYEQALVIKREIKDRQVEAITLYNLGVIYKSLNQFEKAREHYEQALAIRREIKDRRGEGDSLGGMMRLYEVLKKEKLAIFYGKQAVNAYQEIRGNIKGLEQESRKSFLKTVENAYRDLTNLLLAQNRLAEAQQVLNAFKDQQFFDFNQTVGAEPAPLTLTPREAAFVVRYEQASVRVRDIRRQLDDLQSSLGERKPGNAEAKRLQELEANLKTATDDFYALLKQADAEFSQPNDEKDKAGEVPDMARMQSTLRELSGRNGQQAVAIYTLVGEESFSVLLITPKEIRKAQTSITANELNKKVLQFYRALQTPAYDPRPVGKEVYDIIFKPIEREIRNAGAQTLLWSLDGTLAYVPMAALSPDGRGYLVEHYQNVVFTRADKERMTRAVSPNWTGTGFGSSVAHAVNLFGETLKLPALPGVTTELDAVFRAGDNDGIFKGEVFADAEFKKETLFAALKQKRPLVHISSHFIFRPGDDTRSFLLLGDGTALTLNELKKQERLFEGVELLTLSACETAAQQPDANGREIDGFAELAQRLGAGAVFASLWSVADRSTADLMKQFYRYYKTAPQTSKGAALRRAQLAMLQGSYKSRQTGARSSNLKVEIGDDKKALKPFKRDANAPYAHPYYWSPFILIGNWR